MRRSLRLSFLSRITTRVTIAPENNLAERKSAVEATKTKRGTDQRKRSRLANKSVPREREITRSLGRAFAIIYAGDDFGIYSRPFASNPAGAESRTNRESKCLVYRWHLEQSRGRGKLPQLFIIERAYVEMLSLEVMFKTRNYVYVRFGRLRN